MKFAAAALAFAAGVMAGGYPASNMTYTTEVVTAYETYCPGPTTITYGTATYTATEPTTITITDCPCTISKPVYTTSTVECSTCAPTTYPGVPEVTPTTYPGVPEVTPTTAPIYPTGPAPPSNNGTYPSPSSSVPPSYPTATPPTAGAAKAAVAGMAGVLGLAAYIL